MPLSAERKKEIINEYGRGNADAALILRDDDTHLFGRVRTVVRPGEAGVLGAIADYTPLKKRLMLAFAYTGATATILLFLVQGNLILLGGLLFIIGLGYLVIDKKRVILSFN